MLLIYRYFVTSIIYRILIYRRKRKIRKRKGVERGMFSQQIEGLWKNWYEGEKPRESHGILAVCLGFIIAIAGVVVYTKYAVAGGMTIAAGFFSMMIAACSVSGKKHKLVISAAEYGWKCGVYDTGRGERFPFMDPREGIVLGGKRFSYPNVEIVLYDTVYDSKNNSPGILMEIITGTSEKEIESTCKVCMERITEMQRRYVASYRYTMGDGKHYLYIGHAAMGLVVDENGKLYPKTAGNPDGCWERADKVVAIMNECFGTR